MKSSFVKPEADRAYLKDGERWVELKKRLNIREHRTAQMGAIGRMHQSHAGAGGERETSYELEEFYDKRKAEAYIVDWNFVGDDGKAVRVSLQAIEALDVDTFEEVKGLIEAREDASAEEKKAPAGSEPVPKSVAISA